VERGIKAFLQPEFKGRNNNGSTLPERASGEEGHLDSLFIRETIPSMMANEKTIQKRGEISGVDANLHRPETRELKKGVGQ